MSSATQKTIVRLNHTDTNDTAAVDILIKVPASEPPYQKTSNITFLAMETT